MKKKIFVVALAACLLILSVAGSSIAYFTDVESATNVFTIGNVDIALTYANSAVDGDDAVNTNDILDVTDENVYPSNVLTKNVKITNVSKNDAAYVGATITLTNVDGRLGLTAGNVIEKFFNDTFMANATVNVVDDGAGTITIYVIVTDDVEVGDSNAVTIFEQITIPAEWDNAQMALFANVKVSVNAYATQTAGFNNAIEAIHTAFDNTVWDDSGITP